MHQVFEEFQTSMYMPYVDKAQFMEMVVFAPAAFVLGLEREIGDGCVSPPPTPRSPHTTDTRM